MPTLTIFDSTDLEEVDNIDDIKTFYRLLYNLNQATLLMSQATTLDDLYRVAVESATQLLEIDRIGILLIDQKRNRIQGTWGTDELGNVHAEHHQSSPAQQEFSDVIKLISNQGKVCIWQDQTLYEFNEQGEDGTSIVGFGWNGAIALWENDQLIGWLACDNLINKRPFKNYISHILRLFGSVLSEYRLRFLAQQKIENLNATLEAKVIKRTTELVAAQQALQVVNQNLEMKVQQRTNSLKEKNVELANTIAQLKNTQTELQHAQAHAAMNDLVVGVAHEVNTPLGCAITASSHIPYILDEMQLAVASSQQQAFPALLKSLKDTSYLLERNLNSTASLISEFKRLSTLDIEPIPAQKINLQHWLQNTLLHARTYEENIKSLNISTLINTDISEVIIQADVFIPIFQEILLNAYLHNPKRQDNRITIKIEIQEQQLFIYIEDNGQAIEGELQQRIFNPFVTTLRNAGRKGLGLNIAFNLVHFMLKGSLTYFDSRKGGAGFLIRCPITLVE